MLCKHANIALTLLPRLDSNQPTRLFDATPAPTACQLCPPDAEHPFGWLRFGYTSGSSRVIGVDQG